MSATRRKRLVIQGATGSIGQSTLDVVRAHHESFQVVGVAARRSVRKILALAQEFSVASVALAEECDLAEQATSSRQGNHPQVMIGPEALAEQASTVEYDLLVNGVTGSAGLEPTRAALSRGIPVALANKESLVAAGPLILQEAHDHGTQVIPIDSEHNAIFQCLLGENRTAIRKIWLTTSGGPFWDRPSNELISVTVEETLHHPTWRMGAKISIDSATLFNKGLEVIEAARLFGLGVEQIGVVVHRQSVVHSMVEFVDGSIKAQLSIPDMRLPILYSLTYPERVASALVRTPVDSLGHLSFEPVPLEKHPCLRMAFEALRRGGTLPAAISAADEIAVHAFLEESIGFMDIARILEDVLVMWPDEPLVDFEQVRRADDRARQMARQSVSRIANAKEVVRCSSR